MSITIPPVPYNTPISGPSGLLTVPWIAWYRQLFLSIGGNLPNFLTNPMTTLGDLLYGGTDGIATRLPGNTSNAREFLMSQGSGTIAAAPFYGALQAADIPALNYVTSVAMTVPAFLSIAGSPITSSGTLAVTLATQVKNLVFAGPSSGSDAAPTFRAIVNADLPSYTQYNIPVGTGSAGLGVIAPSSTTGIALVSAGSSANPVFGSIALGASGAVSGTLPNANTTATNANTPSTIVARDGSGNFSAGTITASLTGHSSLDLVIANNLSDVNNANTSFNNISPMTTLGDMIYGGTSGAGTRLAGNTTSTKKFLSQTGTGSASVAPGWNVIDTADLPTIILTGDITGSNSGGSVTTTVAKIAGTVVSGTTGTTNAVFSNAPILTSPVVGTQSQLDGSTKAASTAYVDTAVANAVAGVNPAVAVQAATTAAGDTSGFTYNNGVSGVGATFTGTANTAITIDGYTFTALGQRLLVKNDTQSPSGAFNGIYYVTQVQTTLLAPILTRALDYNSPSDMNNTGAIPVINGTANGTTSWVLTSLVVTVGTTPLTFTEFTRNPADYLLKANNLSDVSTKATAFNNLSPMTTAGDVIYGGASGVGTRLGIGTQYQVFQAGATNPAYGAVQLAQSAAVTGVLPNANTTAASANTLSAIVARDGSGNFIAGTITAALTGNVTGNCSGTSLSFTGSLTGDVGGTYGATTIGSGKVTNGMLAGSIAASKLVGTDIATVGTITAGVWTGTTIAIANGGTGVTSVTTAPAASTFAGWDANKNLSANNHIPGFRTQATANSTLTLVVGDAFLQVFTGTTAGQIVSLATTSIVAGQGYFLVNLSNQSITVNSSAGNLVQTMAASSVVNLIPVVATPTTAANWAAIYSTQSAGGGSVTSVATGSVNGLSFTGGPITTSGTLTPVLTAPTAQRFTAAPTGATNYTFTITSHAFTRGDTYTNNGSTFTVLSASATSTTVFMSGTGTPAASGTLTWASGGGSGNITFSAFTGAYVLPSPTPLYLKVRMSGGGGGGSGGGSGASTVGGTGGSTTFGATLTAGGGSGGTTYNLGGGGSGAGGTNTNSLTGAITLVNAPGGAGSPGQDAVHCAGGTGGANIFGGNGAGGTDGVAGTAGTVNTGGGGGGGGDSGAASNGGGGSGGYLEVFVPSPSSLYQVTIGASGTAGASTHSGGAGGTGIVVIEESYQ